QSLPDMGLIDLFHLDHANLPHGDAVKGHLDDARDVTLISEKPQIVPFRCHLAHHARFAGRHLADDGGKDWILSVRDALHFEVGIEQSLRNVTRGLAEGSFRLPKLSS